MAKKDTKYNVGDVVIMRKYKDLNAMQMNRKGVKSWDVVDIEDPQSRSPTYILRERSNRQNRKEAKASELKKMF